MAEIAKTNNEKIADLTGYKPEEIAVLKSTVAKGTTDLEFTLFMSVSKSLNLNPFNKEVWCYKDNRGNLITFAGRDGFLKIAQGDHRWNGIVSSEVRKNDVFEIDMQKGEIIHKPNYLKDRGEIVGAYCYIKPKGCEIATIEWADFATYNRNSPTWKSHPAAMIKKIAETNALKKAFGISGLQSEYEFTVNETTNTVYAIDTEHKPSENQLSYAESLLNTSSYDETSREFVMDELTKEDLTQTELDDIIRNLKENQLNPIESGQGYGQKEIHEQLDLKMSDPNA
jgi:hypothetical protein